MIALGLSGCDRGTPGRARTDSGKSTGGEAMAATSASASQGPPYTTRPLDSFGKVSGFIELDGQPPPDTVFQPSVDQPICGAAFTRRGIERSGNRAIGVVVWIDGLRSGRVRSLKAPEVRGLAGGGGRARESGSRPVTGRPQPP